MKTIAIGDIHGSTYWRDLIDQVDDYDKIIFVGDYVDHWTISSITIKDNLEEIIKFKQDNPEKVELLLGNHDAQYMYSGRIHSCSGFRRHDYTTLHGIFTEHKDLFKIAHYEESKGQKYLWTHAGVCNEWYVSKLMPFVDKGRYMNIGEAINDAYTKYATWLFDVGYSRYGNDLVGGPLWADQDETKTDMLDHVHQIVGHSKVPEIIKYDERSDTSITYIDVFEGDNPDFYKLNF